MLSSITRMLISVSNYPASILISVFIGLGLFQRKRWGNFNLPFSINKGKENVLSIHSAEHRTYKTSWSKAMTFFVLIFLTKIHLLLLIPNYLYSLTVVVYFILMWWNDICICPNSQQGQYVRQGQILSSIEQVWIQSFSCPRLDATPELQSLVYPTLYP